MTSVRGLAICATMVSFCARDVTNYVTGATRLKVWYVSGITERRIAPRPSTGS